MRNIFIGVIIGMLLGGGIVYAAQRVVLVNGQGSELGTASNPINIAL